MQKKYDEFSLENNVAIPIIQRDYVQGADKNYEKRNKFIKQLLDSLLTNKHYEIDFIFGSCDSKYFIPVDGQQRLTTLFLLAWLLNQKCKGSYTTNMNTLTYTSRPSTEQFCKELSNFNLPEKYDSISDYIKKEPGWFSYGWLDDPSINAMLDLLDYADKMLSEPPYIQNIEVMAKRFFNDSPITFDLLDMNALNLNDDLYIKMNARGKLLTPFENWKAEFEGFLDDHFPHETYKYGKIPDEDEYPTIKDYFEYAIEHEWCDMLWPIAYGRWSKLSDSEKKMTIYPRIDESFMNLIDFISRFIFYSSYSEGQLDSMAAKLKDRLRGDKNENWYRKLFEYNLDTNRISVYNCNKNVELLFRILDSMVEIQREYGNFNSFFDLIFVSNDSSKMPISSKVNLYDSPSVDLVTLCLDGKMDYFREITLWAVMRWGIEHPECHRKGADLTSITDYTRVIVGWARGRNQRLTKGLNVSMNLRVTHYQEVDRIISELVMATDLSVGLSRTTETSMAEEREKGKFYGTPKFEIIRKLSPCRSLFYCFNLLIQSIENIDDSEVEDYIAKFYSFMSLNDTDRIQTLVKHGFTGVKTGLSNFYFYGLDKKWDYIFTMNSQDESFSNTSESLISSILSQPEKINQNNKLQYYITKYPDFIEARDNIRWPESKPTYYFKQNHWWEIWAVKTLSTNPLLGYNVEPFGFVVQQLYKGNKLRLWSESEYSEHGRLWIKAKESDKYDLTMECVEQGWKISCFDKRCRTSKAFLSRYNESINPNGNSSYSDSKEKFNFMGDVLSDLPNLDRIQTALTFIEDLDKLI